MVFILGVGRPLGTELAGVDARPMIEPVRHAVVKLLGIETAGAAGRTNIPVSPRRPGVRSTERLLAYAVVAYCERTSFGSVGNVKGWARLSTGPNTSLLSTNLVGPQAVGRWHRCC